jgi:protein TonB
VIGGVIGGVATGIAPPAPVRVGGRVKPPTWFIRVEPEYPPLARQAHIQGDVLIEVILDEHGSVEEAKVVSGPPLLIQAALNAVRKWKYEPTYLNDKQVSVQLKVTVTFRINQ